MRPLPASNTSQLSDEPGPAAGPPARGRRRRRPGYAGRSMSAEGDDRGQHTTVSTVLQILRLLTSLVGDIGVLIGSSTIDRLSATIDEGIATIESHNGRYVNLPDQVRRLYAGPETGRATDSSLR